MLVRFIYGENNSYTFQVREVREKNGVLLFYVTLKGKKVFIKGSFWNLHMRVIAVETDYFFKGVQNARADRPKRRAK